MIISYFGENIIFSPPKYDLFIIFSLNDSDVFGLLRETRETRQRNQEDADL